MFATSAKPLSRRSRNLPPGPVVVDVQGLHLTDAERRRLRHPLVGGVILFARNYQSPGQLRALTDEIHACRTPPLLVAVDAGLLLYWAAVFLNLIPEHLRFKDYSNQVIQAWNWSFFPLDVAAALTVFLGAPLTRAGGGTGGRSGASKGPACPPRSKTAHRPTVASQTAAAIPAA